MLVALLASCASAPVTIPLRADPAPDIVPIDAPEQEFADWTVDCEGGGDFTTISEAIEAASDNEWIQVQPCTYAETVDFGGKSVWISSTAGSGETIIDAGHTYGVVASRGEGDGAALVGFTLQNGGGDYGTVYVSLAALRLEDVVISDSSGGYFLIYSSSGDLELQDVSFQNSRASAYSVYGTRGAIVADGLTADCSGNSYAFVMAHGSYFLDHTDLTCTAGYALYNENAVGRVHRSTLRGGLYATTDEDHYTDTNQFENTLVKGNIYQEYGTLIFRNSVLDGGSITTDDLYELKLQASVFQNASCAFTSAWSGADTGVTPEQTVEYNDFYGLATDGCDGAQYVGSEGNIDADPLFTDTNADDYSTATGSPLVDAGLPDSEYDDPDGSTNDIGLFGGPRGGAR